MKKLLIAAAAVALISGCSDNGPKADKDGNIPADEVAKEMNKVNLEPGEWENTVEITDVVIEGLPKGANPAMIESIKGQKTTSKSCITKEQASNPGAGFFAAQKETNCEVKKFNMSGGGINSEMVCKSMGGAPGNMTMVMDGQYGPSNYEMTMTMSGDAGPMKMNMKAKNNGKRIGDCPA